MRIDFWFDFNKDSYQTLINLNDALDSFRHQADVSVFYRSSVKDEKNFYLHAIYHYGRKKELDKSFMIKLFELAILEKSKEEIIAVLSVTYQLNLKDLSLAPLDEKYKKIVLNQMEHAALNKINITPTLTFSHGLRLTGLNNKDEIKNVLIAMYEKEMGIEYCDSGDCER
ncbi:hypothetical protein JV173_01040 [Acholeplasma equirhinis]|uniref:hypothetical protein n=1 Tax=Acholeplasma equirhinis TaxID=555393 RepID=UPI00197AE8C8|nr:hypothetical protein [Acholeplasma equirhinis]MBN3490090.1 hypothetical protein [Acholeplasma equirhinis]